MVSHHEHIRDDLYGRCGWVTAVVGMTSESLGSKEAQESWTDAFSLYMQSQVQSTSIIPAEASLAPQLTQSHMAQNLVHNE